MIFLMFCFAALGSWHKAFSFGDAIELDQEFLAEVAACLENVEARVEAPVSETRAGGLGNEIKCGGCAVRIKADQQIRLKYGSPGSALLHAAKRNEIEEAKKALAVGAKLTACNRRWCTPLMLASLNGHVQMVDLLLKEYTKKYGSQASIYINAYDLLDRNALHFALIKKHQEVVDLLLYAGAELPEITFFDLTEESGQLQLDCSQPLPSFNTDDLLSLLDNPLSSQPEDQPAES